MFSQFMAVGKKVYINSTIGNCNDITLIMYTAWFVDSKHTNFKSSGMTIVKTIMKTRVMFRISVSNITVLLTFDWAGNLKLDHDAVFYFYYRTIFRRLLTWHFSSKFIYIIPLKHIDICGSYIINKQYFQYSPPLVCFTSV